MVTSAGDRECDTCKPMTRPVHCSPIPGVALRSDGSLYAGNASAQARLLGLPASLQTW